MRQTMRHVNGVLGLTRQGERATERSRTIVIEENNKGILFQTKTLSLNIIFNELNDGSVNVNA